MSTLAEKQQTISQMPTTPEFCDFKDYLKAYKPEGKIKDFLQTITGVCFKQKHEGKGEDKIELY